jgi:hypothetical protein
MYRLTLARIPDKERLRCTKIGQSAIWATHNAPTPRVGIEINRRSIFLPKHHRGRIKVPQGIRKSRGHDDPHIGFIASDKFWNTMTKSHPNDPPTHAPTHDNKRMVCTLCRRLSQPGLCNRRLRARKGDRLSRTPRHVTASITKLCSRTPPESVSFGTLLGVLR